ncbi:deoxyguanosinetriphosphate triphosphohydrolase [Alkalicella caledoniensis]|uniref:Deoxyguanosinetriphosphate triphosphohydrolase-like protein n=1 Tax=Alkalicella caledoniensis TaxID=2731377 RepID=A0A7G9WC19_ALKCA|nr:deoxyguanosinetriphosphate triphosphohydrolase [Alkalicella caledoniensis]QNO16231.1 deoxyguanosinetriphosphate triphosphohydrolase [Alkalicella caledoniensis]
MSIRQISEELEKKMFSQYAAFSSESKGRKVPELPCAIRTQYQRDRDRILHSKAFRRLKHKTQVFLSPESDHFRTRLTHTLEVAQISRTIARALRLNEDLTEAIALGHDLGHTPFGHAGEEALNSVASFGFKHNEQSLRIVETLEKDVGLNLTYEVLDGILNHTGSVKPITLEGQIVKIADRIAYINHDIEDAISARIISADQLPYKPIQILGFEKGKRIDTLIKDIVVSSVFKDTINQSTEVKEAMTELRNFLFERVYINSPAKLQEQKAKNVITLLYHFYMEFPRKLNTETITKIKDDNLERTVCDFIAGMTDRYILKKFGEHFLPLPWQGY